MIWPDVQTLSSFADSRGETHGFDLPFAAARMFIVQNTWYVARGFHRQKDMDRFIYVVDGKIIDVLRNEQGETKTYHLKAGDLLRIPAKIYHGYYSEYPSTILYVASKTYIREDEENIVDPGYFMELANVGRDDDKLIYPVMNARDKGQV